MHRNNRAKKKREENKKALRWSLIELRLAVTYLCNVQWLAICQAQTMVHVDMPAHIEP